MAASGSLIQVRAFVFDVDGTLALALDPNSGAGIQAFPDAGAVLTGVEATGRRFVCFTNGSGQVPAEQAARLRAAGLPVADEQMLTPAHIAAAYLAREHPGAAVLAFGNEGLLQPLRAAGISLSTLDEAEHAAAVVVGADPEFTYPKLVAACRAVWAGASLLVTSMAPWFASRSGRMPSTSGAIAAGIVHSTGAEPIVVGKPSPLVISVLSQMLGCAASELAVIGDDVHLEIRMAREAGASAVLVLSGSTSVDDLATVATDLQPHLVLPAVGALRELL
jgi:HAD superfamily hydrolase (TIGR01450 family)